MNGFFKFVMGKGGFLKTEAPGFNLDTSSVSPGYVPVQEPVFGDAQISSAYLTQKLGEEMKEVGERES